MPGGNERSTNCRKARDYIGRNPRQQAMPSNPDPDRPSELPLTSLPAVVLDTNVVLDWLLFGDSLVGPVAAAVTGGRVDWLATAAMRDELAHVLGRGLAASRGADAARLLGLWDRHARMRAAAPAHHLACSDPDDQKFLDLALATRARWLVSRDRALLKLGRRAAVLGLAIVTPERWQIDK